MEGSFFLNPRAKGDKSNYGFKTEQKPPHEPLLDDFKDSLLTTLKKITDLLLSAIPLVLPINDTSSLFCISWVKGIVNHN